MKALAQGTCIRRLQYGLGLIVASDRSTLLSISISAVLTLGTTPGAK